MAKQEQTLSHALRNIRADLDEAFMLMALNEDNPEHGLDCLARARKTVDDVIHQLENNVMKPVVP